MTDFTCDLTTGTCGPNGADAAATTLPGAPESATVRITYITDPICSACWAMEPAWRAARLRFGDAV